MTKDRSAYTPMPEVPQEARPRYQAVLEVLSGATTMSEAAQRLGLSRVRFQTLLHRSLAAMLAELSPHPAGRPATPEVEKQLRRENEQLKKELARLRTRTNMIDRLLGAASEMLHTRARPSGRQAKKRAADKASPSDDDPGERLEAALVMRSCGLPARLCAAVAGVSVATLRRWQARTSDSSKPPRKAAPLSREQARAVEERVRDTHGLIGADALRHAVPGVSRRQAAAIKANTRTEMERERRARVERVTFSAPDVVRGFDAMHVRTSAGMRYLLIAGDAAVPFRTSIAVVESYDTAAVAAALERDFCDYGAPLVMRFDRAKCHDAPEVAAVLAHHQVLALHGPPRHPCFYGQLERQNREHRAWLEWLVEPSPEELEAAAERMRVALNGLWPRRTLGFRTAQQLWTARAPLAVDRNELREEVNEIVARLEAEPGARPATKCDLARLAIEDALTRKGYLSREVGGWC